MRSAAFITVVSALGALAPATALAQAPPGDQWESWWEAKQHCLLRSREIARDVVRIVPAWEGYDCILVRPARPPAGVLRPNIGERTEAARVLLRQLAGGAAPERAAALVALGEIGATGTDDATAEAALRRGLLAGDCAERAAAVLGLTLWRGAAG